MPEWFVLILTGVLVLMAPLMAAIAVAGFAIWVSHKSKMRKLQLEEMERQAEMDRELLGLTGRDASAHIEAILDRLRSVETRLDKTEAMQNIEVAKARGPASLTASENERASRQGRAEQEERA